MALLTLAEAKASRISEVTQSCADSDEFLSLLNEATKRLMQRGDWPGLVVPIYICIKAGCVTWPRYTGKIRRINRCHQEVKVGNLWYDFVDRHGDSYQNWGHLGSNWGQGRNNSPDPYRLVNKGRSPTYSDIVNANRTIRAYCMVAEDVGKTIQLFGVDTNGQALRTHTGTTWVDGITLTLSLPYATTAGYVRRIDRVIKQKTQGNVPLYAYDAVNNILEDLANYEPSETLPNYERDQIFLGNCCCDNSRSVSALVKLQYVPAEVDTDLVLISNTTALKFMIQAIKLEEAGSRAEAKQCVLDAVAELNLELEDEYPRDQSPVDTGFSGGEWIAHQKMI